MLQQNTTKIKSIKDEEYNNWLKELKNRFKKSQIKAAVKVNSELIRFYWSLGRDIVIMKSEAKWGSKFYETLSKDLKELFPNTSGFSIRNLQYMKQFYDLFSDIVILPQVGAKLGNEIMPQVGAQIFNVPWNHLKYIIDKVDGDKEKVLFFINEIIKNNWSRDVLSTFLNYRI